MSGYSLRDLPIPAKVVITCFLLAVGGGYFAALVQLHLQDSKSGKPMPTLHDVVLKYTGKKWFANEKDIPRPESTFVRLITAPENLPFGGAGTMAPAFTTQDGGGPNGFNTIGRTAPADTDRLRNERLGERDVLALWARENPEVRKKAFEDDHYGVSDKAREPQAITAKFKSPDGAYKVRSIITDRCTRCHKPDGDDVKAAKYHLQTYEQVDKYLGVPPAASIGTDGGWVRVQEPIGLEKLTQSTHAHLLSFAMLFSLTGLVFAFTSYPAALRCVLGPWVLVAVVADVALWWLARLSDEWGPTFAMGIIGTGAAAGVGLALQITLSLFNMYGPKGKIVVLAIFLLGGVGAWQLYVNKMKPGLDQRQQDSLAEKKTNPAPDNGAKKTNGNSSNGNPGNGKDPPEKVDGGKVAQMLTVPAGTDVLKLPWKKGEVGGMARAFFDKDSAEFAAALKEKDEEGQKKLAPLRQGEREALLAWVKLAEAQRRKAYDEGLPLPSDWGKKPITPDYLKGGKLQVQAIITDRCMRCHDGADEDQAPFNDYESLSKYLK